MINHSIYTDKFLTHIQDNPHTENRSRTVWATDKSFIKCYLGNPIVLEGNAQYFTRTYGSISNGVDAVVRIINTLDPGLITDYAYIDNYYLETVSPRIEKTFALHSSELIQRVGGIRSYVSYFKRTVEHRNSVLGDLSYMDYHPENVFVHGDLSWTCVDFDEVFVFGADFTESLAWDKIKYKFLGSQDLLQYYDKSLLEELWNSV